MKFQVLLTQKMRRRDGTEYNSLVPTGITIRAKSPKGLCEKALQFPLIAALDAVSKLELREFMDGAWAIVPKGDGKDNEGMFPWEYLDDDDNPMDAGALVEFRPIDF